MDGDACTCSLDRHSLLSSAYGENVEDSTHVDVCAVTDAPQRWPTPCLQWRPLLHPPPPDAQRPDARHPNIIGGGVSRAGRQRATGIILANLAFGASHIKGGECVAGAFTLPRPSRLDLVVGRVSADGPCSPDRHDLHSLSHGKGGEDNTDVDVCARTGSLQRQPTPFMR